MPRIRHVFTPCYSFACFSGEGADRQSISLQAAYIDLFHKTGDLQTVVVGRAIDAGSPVGLGGLPRKLEIWSLPSSPALSYTFRVLLQVDDWTWSPLDLDARRDAIALEWAAGSIVDMTCTKMPLHVAPDYVQELVG